MRVSVCGRCFPRTVENNPGVFYWGIKIARAVDMTEANEPQGRPPMEICRE